MQGRDDTAAPEATLRDWMVAGGLLRRGGELLLVRNRRRDGRHDWSTPGGVIDEGELVLDGLTREVREETGLVVDGWAALAYRVEVSFPAQGWRLRVESHVAATWSGDIRIDDPDGIVVAADFVSGDVLSARLGEAPQWVGEPILEWLAAGTEADVGATPPLFRYLVDRRPDGGLLVERLP